MSLLAPELAFFSQARITDAMTSSRELMKAVEQPVGAPEDENTVNRAWEPSEARRAVLRE